MYGLVNNLSHTRSELFFLSLAFLMLLRLQTRSENYYHVTIIMHIKNTIYTKRILAQFSVELICGNNFFCAHTC